MISSGAWTMLNLYLVISLCAVVFDLFIMLSEGLRKKQQENRKINMRKTLEYEFERIGYGDAMVEKERRKLYRMLSQEGYLLAFSEIAEEYSSSGDIRFKQFVDQTGEVFDRLTRVYRKKDIMLKSSYAWALSRCRYEIPSTYGFLIDCVLEKKSIYCRENALLALYRGGSVKKLVTALKLMSRNDIRHSEKLLSDGFLSFTGSKEQLAAALWDCYADLSNNVKLAVVDFIKQISADYKEEFVELLRDESVDDELSYAVLRYFSKIQYEPAMEIMLELLNNPRNGRWEYAAVSASSLRTYKTRQVTRALKEALGSPNWYVRYNSADSLMAMKLPESEYEDILNGRDRFAREIMGYMLNRRQLSASEIGKSREGVGVLGVS